MNYLVNPFFFSSISMSICFAFSIVSRTPIHIFASSASGLRGYLFLSRLKDSSAFA